MSAFGDSEWSELLHYYQYEQKNAIVPGKSSYDLVWGRGLSSSRLHNPSEMGVLAGEVAESTIDAFTPTSKARVDSYDPPNMGKALAPTNDQQNDETEYDALRELGRPAPDSAMNTGDSLINYVESTLGPLISAENSQAGGIASQDITMIARQCGWNPGQEGFLGRLERTFSAPQVTGRGYLGHGSLGIVEEVLCAPGHQTCVRKRVTIQSTSRFYQARKTKAVEREIALLRRIDHIHIVKVIGAYQEDISPRFSYFILMHPVGESDLDAFLVTAGSIIRTEPNVPGSNCERYIMYLRTWFLCLASALTYLHEQGILHEDIKPRNIIHRGVDVFFIDFGSSREFDLVNNLTSTESPVLATRLYAAPEAADRIDSEGNISRHGLKTDVFSLGIVFFEMLTVLDLKEVGELRDRVPQGSCYHMITSSFGNWLVAESCVNFYEEYVAPMLKHERKERPRAKEVLEALNNTSWLTLECPCRSS